MRRTQRLLFSGLISFITFVSHFNGCSHYKPYYRTDITHVDSTIYTDSSLVERFILIGDAGETQEDDPLLASLSQWCRKDPLKTHVLFLGDNIYPRGLDEENAQSRKTAEKYLYAQLNVIQSSAVKGIFLPGNHDWGRGGESGRDAILSQEEIVKNTLQDEMAFLPGNACPGPVFMDTETMRLIILDSDHWINDKIAWPIDCSSNSEQAFLANLRQLLETTSERPVVVLGHHPLDTYGPHGGFFDWQDHIFPFTRLIKWLYIPLPIIGSLYPLGRTYLVKSNQDLVGPNYQSFVRDVNNIFKDKKPLFYAAGHEHTLQVLEGESVQYILVSGAGSIPRISPVGHGQNTLFAHSHAGFMVVDVLEDGRIQLKVVEPPDGHVVYQTFLVVK